MGLFGGLVEHVLAGQVRVGDLLVDDRAATGYLAVTDVRDDGGVFLVFDGGGSVTYSRGEKLYRVVTR